jgi:hypothetical protein
LDEVTSAKCFISFGIRGQGMSPLRPMPLFLRHIAAMIEKGLMPEKVVYY